MPFFDYTTPFAPLQAPEPRPDPISNALDSILQRQTQERNLEAQRLHLDQQHQNALALEKQRQAGDMALETAKEKNARALRDSTEDATNMRLGKAKAAEAIRRGASLAEVRAILAEFGLTEESTPGEPAVASPVPSVKQDEESDMPPVGIPSSAPPAQGAQTQGVDEVVASALEWEPKVTDSSALNLLKLPTQRKAVAAAIAQPERPPIEDAFPDETIVLTPEKTEAKSPVKDEILRLKSLHGTSSDVLDFGQIRQEREQEIESKRTVLAEAVSSYLDDPDIADDTKKAAISAAKVISPLIAKVDKPVDEMVKIMGQILSSQGQKARADVGQRIAGQGEAKVGLQGESVAKANVESWAAGVNAKKIVESNQKISKLEIDLAKVKSEPEASQLAISDLQFTIAKEMNGMGVLTDKDVERAGGKWGVKDWLQNWVANKTTGLPTGNQIKAIETLLALGRAHKQQLGLELGASFRGRFLGDANTPSQNLVPGYYKNYYGSKLQDLGVTDEQVVEYIRKRDGAKSQAAPAKPTAASVASPVPSGAPGAQTKAKTGGSAATLDAIDKLLGR